MYGNAEREGILGCTLLIREWIATDDSGYGITRVSAWRNIVPTCARISKGWLGVSPLRIFVSFDCILLYSS